MPFTIEASPLGRVVLAPNVPPGFALFYTTADFPGRLGDGVDRLVTSFIHDRFGIDASLTTCTQVHGATIRVARAERSWRECDACDALLSAEAQTALGIKVADCLPVSFIDPQHGTIANIHSGWRGTVQQITGATLTALREQTAFNPATALAWLGPSIRQCCFEVGEDVVTSFEQSFGDVSAFVDRRGARPHVDVVGVTMRVLREAGFAGERIFDSGLCTRCDGSIFHSYRRDAGSGGRNLAVVAH
jgi:polyphenol oxidase